MAKITAASNSSPGRTSFSTYRPWGEKRAKTPINSPSPTIEPYKAPNSFQPLKLAHQLDLSDTRSRGQYLWA